MQYWHYVMDKEVLANLTPFPVFKFMLTSLRPNNIFQTLSSISHILSKLAFNVLCKLHNISIQTFICE